MNTDRESLSNVDKFQMKVKIPVFVYDNVCFHVLKEFAILK
jgi:hypothetical protein